MILKLNLSDSISTPKESSDELKWSVFTDSSDTPVKRCIKKQSSKKEYFESIDIYRVHSVASVISAHIEDAEVEGYFPSSSYSVFNKGGCDIILTEYSHSAEDVPIRTIERFVTLLHQNASVEYEHMIIALIYVERIMRITNMEFRLCSYNWKAAFMTCCLLSCKIFDDFSMLNCDFASSIGNGMLEVERVNALELKLVEILDFSCFVSAEEYYTAHSRVEAAAAAYRQEEESITENRFLEVAPVDIPTTPPSSPFQVRYPNRIQPEETVTDGLVAVTKPRYKPVKWTLHKGAVIKNAVKHLLGSAVSALAPPQQQAQPPPIKEVVNRASTSTQPSMQQETHSVSSSGHLSVMPD
mmetsp:Transcript_6206/g.9358  ORF Transcript_6206/g.9358 Transcript_6206/m.9358 type:complete len:355 (+) Transcript_6206:152-1216(+)|eukprot:CAMPEP_0185030656 /NCGR_PEP_ID=MMETSP1103-20130426/17647_1 /TAXON_ID=36769 /ORGANISM="Paraphysomonas bandaiensis, Strain Caron Lab Isolate" /LENGTH=354 /DNA_ID=CAMNT_0027565867 /DNA_START=107 /DNA_END=1171 /DNA_ORIENTATION=+